MEGRALGEGEGIVKAWIWRMGVAGEVDTESIGWRFT